MAKPRLALEIVTQTDPGRVRALNEDRIAADAELGVVILADGMGGQAAGSHAAEMAVEIAGDEIKRALGALRDAPGEKQNGAIAIAVQEAAANANRAIHALAQSEHRYRDMGTTLLAAVFYENTVTVAHAGDSRLYRLREDKLKLLTRDHSLLQEQLEMAAISREAARDSHNRHLVSRALGTAPEIALDVKTGEVAPGDLFLVCSDGLNDMVDDENIELALALLKSNLALAASQLVMMARDQGGHDNISVILVRAHAPGGWLARLARGFR